MFASNGVNGVGRGSEPLQWKVGMVNHQNRYLTAETFGFKINASGNTLRKKQTWILEQDPNEDVVYIKSHLGRYLSSDKKGNVKCESESRGEEEKYIVVYSNDGSGRWAFQSKVHTYFFGGIEDNLRCYEKGPTMTEWWTVRLGVHPQVNMKNVNRKRYAHLHAENEQIQFDETIPWGQDALITLEFRDGKYAVKTCDNRYLHREGYLTDRCTEDTLYTLEIKSGQHSGLALKDNTGRYLTAVGKEAKMVARNKVISKDELFTVEDSHPQAFFTAHNGRKVSIKQGIDLTANQDEVTDKETFQIEFDKSSTNWRIRTAENKYWSLEQASGIQNVGNGTKPTGLFSFEFTEDGKVAIKANNGRYITAKLNGSLYATMDSASEKELFYITVDNRPILVLRCEYGFVGFKAGSSKVECNRSNYDIITMEHTNGTSGNYYFKSNIKGANKYWSIGADGMVNADSSEPQPFMIQLKGQSKFVIKAPNGMYLKGEQNGILSATAPDIQKATQWEY